jgi:hypothetical protein
MSVDAEPTDTPEHEPEPEDGAPDAVGPTRSQPPAPYVHDAASATRAAEVLDEAMLHLTRLIDFSNVVKASLRASGVDESLEREMLSFAWYRLRLDRSGGGAGAVLEPLQPDESGWSFPVAIRSASDDSKALWDGIAAQVTDPVPLARAHDLSFSSKVGDVGNHAKAAVATYLLWPATAMEPIYVSEGLARAWTIARQIGNEQLEGDVYAAVASYARTQLNQGGNPGTVMPLLEMLTTSPRKATNPVARSDLDQLVADACESFPPSYLQVRLAAMMRRIATSDAEREVADRLEVQTHLDEASRSADGGARMIHLDQAAKVARRVGVKDLEAIAIKGMQSIAPEDLGLQVIEASSELPPYIAEAVLRGFDEQDDWRGALHYFLHTPAPTGSYERNLKSAERSLEGSLLRHLFGGVRIGDHGLPQQSIGAGDEQLEGELVMFEQIAASNYGRWYAIGLRRMGSTYGVPSKDDIVAFLVSTYRCDAALAESFATALRLFLEGEFSASAHLAVPKVEAGARRLLLALNEPLYRVELGKKIGQFPGLGFLLPQLVKEGFQVDWERFLGTLLLARGYNLRNLVAHGFIDDISPSNAALALRAAGLMALFGPARGGDDEQAVRAFMPDPVALTARYKQRFPIRAWARRVQRRIRRSTRNVGRPDGDRGAQAIR